MTEPILNSSSTRPYLPLVEARALAEAWRASGLNGAAFARSRDIDPKVVYRCVRRAEKMRVAGAGEAATFVPVAKPVPSSNCAESARLTRQLTWHLADDLGVISGSTTALSDLLTLMLRNRAAAQR